MLELEGLRYNKVVNGAHLHDELLRAGFLVKSIYSKYNSDDPPSSEPYCIVVLEDAETKDPTAIVEAHIPKRFSDADIERQKAEEVIAKIRVKPEEELTLIDCQRLTKALAILRRQSSGTERRADVQDPMETDRHRERNQKTRSVKRALYSR